MSTNSNSLEMQMDISGPMDISSPYNTRHVTHVGFDANTGEFTGLPREWHTLLKSSGITQIEQEQNPQVIKKQGVKSKILKNWFFFFFSP